MIMKKISKFIYVIEFLLIIFGMGIISGVKLLEYYSDPKKIDNDLSGYTGSLIEHNLAYSFFGKTQFINMNGGINRLLNRPFMNDIVKLENGYLLRAISYSSDETLKKYCDATESFQRYLKERGTELVYVSTPYTSSKYDPQLPPGIKDYGNDNIDRFIKMLDKVGVDYIDIRESMHKDGIDQYKMMYRTDHHWNTEAGLYAYGRIEDYIVKKTGCKVEQRVSDIRNYSITTYQKWHLGSNGQRTGTLYGGIDDFDLIIPDFDTFLVKGNGDIHSMQDLMIDMRPLQNKDYTSRYTYDNVYEGTLSDFRNEQCENDVCVMIITDSYGKVVIPYLALGFKRVVYAPYDILVTPDKIEEHDPDIVIMLYYAQRLEDGEKAFAFSGF